MARLSPASCRMVSRSSLSHSSSRKRRRSCGSAVQLCTSALARLSWPRLAPSARSKLLTVVALLRAVTFRVRIRVGVSVRVRVRARVRARVRVRV